MVMNSRKVGCCLQEKGLGARLKPMLASNSGLHCWNVLDKHGRSSCREGKSHRMEGQVVESGLGGKPRVGSSGSEEVVWRHRAGAPYLFLHIATATEELQRAWRLGGGLASSRIEDRRLLGRRQSFGVLCMYGDGLGEHWHVSLPSRARPTHTNTNSQLSTLPLHHQVPLSISVAARSARELSKLAAGRHDGSSLACAGRKVDQI